MKQSKEKILARLPSKLVERLMPFQKDGVEFAVNKNGRCLIADEMGLGKTLQAISVAYYYRQEWPLLIIVPSSLRYSWIEEFEKWLPDINPGEINLIQSGSDARGIGTSQVTIASFGLLSQSRSPVLREALMSQGFKVVIVDESHYIRNIKTVSAKTVMPLIKNANRRILLSGTPALARPVELYPQIDAICPNGFGSWWAYTARYCDAKIEWIGKGKRRNVNGASNLEELQHKLSSTLMIRREKKDVLTQLPAKQRQRVLFELKDSELKKEIRTKFEELIPLLRKKTPREDIGALTGAREQEVGDVSMLSQIQKLYQLSGEAKIGPAKEYVEMLCDNPRLKFLVFAYHRAMMNGVTQSLYDKGVKFIRIDGDTPSAVRPQLVNQFQSDPDTRVAVLSILAAGVGLTFTAATVVVFVEMYWTPGVMVQCEDRAHRIGQTSCVAVHYLVAKDTMDEWVWSAVCKKTIVTSTTLTGRKQALKADAGDQYQIDVLSKADMWVPADNSDLDLMGYLNTQQGTDQKSILDYFSSSQNSETESPQQLPQTSLSPKPSMRPKRFEKSLLSELCDIDNTPEPEGQTAEKLKKEASLENKTSSECKSNDTISDKTMIIIDSGSDDDFTEKRMGRVMIKSSSKTSKTSTKSSNKRNRKDKRKSVPKSTSKCNLVTMFTKAKASATVSSIELSDDDKSDDDDNELDNSKENAICRLNDSSETEADFDNAKNGKYKRRSSPSAVPSKRRKRSHETVVQDSPKATTSAGVSVTSKRWNCPACTFLNHKDLKVCEICNTPQKKKLVSSSGSFVSDPRKEKLSESETNFSTEETETPKKFSTVNGLNKNELKTVDDLSSEIDDVAMEIENDGAAGLLECDDEITARDDNDSDAELTARDDNDSDAGVNDNNADMSGVESESALVEENWNIDQYQSEDDCDVSKSEINGKSITDDDNRVIESSYFRKDQPARCANNENDKHTRRELIVKNSLTIRREESEKNNSHVDSPNNSLKRYHFKSVQRTSCVFDSPTSVRSCSLGQNSGEDIKSSDSCTLTRSRSDSRDKHNIESPYTEEYKDQGRASEEIDSTNQQPSVDGISTDTRVVDLDNVPVHDGFHFQCSKYTGRIYVLTQNDVCLNINFLPMDVEVGNHDDLPDILLHPHNLRLVQRFVREWSSLTETKRRLIIRTGRVFASPLREYEELRSCKTINTQRHRTKQDTEVVAMKKAAEVNGSVRVISKRPWEIRPGEEGEKGVTQVVMEDGTPLCLHCHKPYTNHLLQKASIQNEKNAWNTRFCSQKCSQDYWMVTNNDYCRDMVYEAEMGVCQMCQFDAHALFRQVKDIKDHQRRAEIITKSKMNSLNVKTKEQMVKRPVAGQFWHVDHIVPVWEGGGQCDIDNLRTLCVTCHHKVTARQASKRATVRKLGAAVHSGDITAFFQKIS